MLNQEVVENPLLEEIPSEDLQAAEAQPATDKADEQDAQRATEGKTDNWEDNDYEYFFNDYMDDSYRSRVPTEVKELPPIENTLSTSSSLTDHLEWQLSLKTDDHDDRAIGTAIIGNLDDDGYPGRLGERDRPDGPVADRPRRAGAAPGAELRPDRRRRPRPAGVPHAAAAPARARGHADRADRHRAPAAAAEPPDPRAVAQDGPVHRRAARAHRGHPPPRPEARRPLQPAVNPST